MSLQLPAWAQTPIAKALIDELLASPPETYVRSNKLPSVYGGYAGTPEERFTGKPFCMLRRIYREWFEKQLHALDAQFAVTGHWDEGAARALHDTEDAQALITRLIAEAGEERAAAA